MRVLVVDDEALARARLLRMLERIPGVVVAGEAADGAEARERILELSPDVVLLDVSMPGVDGLELADAPGAPPIIFVTAHVEHATDAFDLDAVDYLVKPVRQDRLARALEKARRRMEVRAAVRPEPLAVHGSGAVRFVDPAAVCAFRAKDKYTVFTMAEEELLVRESLDVLEARLAGVGFVRVHRAGLVRRDAIKGLASEKGVLVARLVDGTRVEVSRRHAPELRRVLGLRR